MVQLTLSISGMTCGHCAGRVTSALNSVAGVEIENVTIGSATVVYDPNLTSPAQILAAVTGAGYTAQPAGYAAYGAETNAETNKELS